MKTEKLTADKMKSLFVRWATILAAVAMQSQEAFAGRFFVSEGAGVFIESGTRMYVDGESLVWGGGGGESENKTKAVRLKGFKSGNRKVRIVRTCSENESAADCQLSVKPASEAGNRDFWLRGHEKVCTCSHQVRKFYAAADWQQNHYALHPTKSVERITYALTVRLCCRGRHFGREPTGVRKERL
jgi:hypothetical protein